MHGWTYASYNLLLAGTFTWVSDVYVVIMVADQMLQAFLLKRCAGYLAYGRTERSDKAADWWAKWRLTVTRVFLRDPHLRHRYVGLAHREPRARDVFQ